MSKILEKISSLQETSNSYWHIDNIGPFNGGYFNVVNMPV